MAALMTNLISNVTAPVNYMLMEGLLKAARANMPYFNGSLPGELMENKGAYSVRYERIENLAAATTALGEPTGNATFFNGRDAVNPTVTRVDANMAKYGNVINLTEEVDLVQVNARAMRFMDTLGENAGRSLNMLQQSAIIAGATNKRYAGGVASDSLAVTAISANDIKYIVNQLNRNDAMLVHPLGDGSVNIGTSPIRSSYFGTCHPDVEEDIRSISGFIPVEQYAGYSSIFPGEFGTLGGVRWCVSTLASVTSAAGTTSVVGFRGAGTTTNDVYSCLIYGREAIGSVGLGENHAKEIYQGGDKIPAVQLISHAPGSSGVADPLNEVGSLGWKAFHAGVVLNTSWVYELRVLSADIGA